METHISELRTFMTKAQYQELANKSSKIAEVDRAFPTAKTNKCQLLEEPIDCIKKLVALIHKEDQKVSYLIESLSRRDYENGDAGTTSYYKDLHARIKTKIRASLGDNNSNDHLVYEFWYDSARQDTIVLFVNPNASATDTAALMDFVDSLDDWADSYTSTQQQKFLNKLFNIMIRLELIGQHAQDISALSERQVNLNNDICFLVKQEESTKKNDSSVIYHALAPSVWISAQNELISKLSYRRYQSSVITPDSVVTSEIDVIIPNSLPSHYERFTDNLKGNGSQLVRINAKEGKQEIDHINLASLGESGLFYKNQFANTLVSICKDAGILHKQVLFDPTLRGRPFVTLAPPAMLDDRPKLTIIVGIPKVLLSQASVTTATYKVKAQNSDEPIKGINKVFDLPYVVSDMVDAYVDHLITNAFTAYDVTVVSIDDINYEDLEYGTNYLFLQEPKPSHGYWRVTTATKEQQLKQALGDDWLSQMHLGIVVPDVGIDRKHDFIDTFRTRQAKLLKDQNATFYTDTYTLWKIKQLESALEGTPKVSLQGIHIPSFHKVANYIANRERFLKETHGSSHYEHTGYQSFVKTRNAVYDKINIDLSLKRVLATKGVVGLINQLGELMDYSKYERQYRCYYVIRPKSRGSNGFYASQLDFSLCKQGISIDSIKLLHNESLIRKDARFPISKSVVSNFYDNSFYLVNEAGEVLTFFSNEREEQPLATLPSFGAYAGWGLSDLYYHKLEAQSTFDNQPVSIAKRTSPKKPKLPTAMKGLPKDQQSAYLKRAADAMTQEQKNEHYESLFIGFDTIPSQGIKAKHFAHFPVGSDIKGASAAGGKEWLFIKELPTKELLIYLTTKRDIHAQKPKANRIYKILVKDKAGKKVAAATSPLAMLYIETTSFHVAKVNDFSAKSLLQSLAKIALKD